MSSVALKATRGVRSDGFLFELLQQVINRHPDLLRADRLKAMIDRRMKGESPHRSTRVPRFKKQSR